MSYVLDDTTLIFLNNILFGGKIQNGHRISLAASTDGLLKWVYCRGVSNDVGLEIAALPRFAASRLIIDHS